MPSVGRSPVTTASSDGSTLSERRESGGESDEVATILDGVRWSAAVLSLGVWPIDRAAMGADGRRDAWRPTAVVLSAGRTRTCWHSARCRSIGGAAPSPSLRLAPRAHPRRGRSLHLHPCGPDDDRDNVLRTHVLAPVFRLIDRPAADRASARARLSSDRCRVDGPAWRDRPAVVETAALTARAVACGRRRTARTQRPRTTTRGKHDRVCTCGRHGAATRGHTAVAAVAVRVAPNIGCTRHHS